LCIWDRDNITCITPFTTSSICMSLFSSSVTNFHAASYGDEFVEEELHEIFTELSLSLWNWAKSSVSHCIWWLADCNWDYNRKWTSRSWFSCCTTWSWIGSIRDEWRSDIVLRAKAWEGELITQLCDEVLFFCNGDGHKKSMVFSRLLECNCDDA
jgi:hypothetical protein